GQCGRVNRWCLTRLLERAAFGLDEIDRFLVPGLPRFLFQFVEQITDRLLEFLLLALEWLFRFVEFLLHFLCVVGSRRTQPESAADDQKCEQKGRIADDHRGTPTEESRRRVAERNYRRVSGIVQVPHASRL